MNRSFLLDPETTLRPGLMNELMDTLFAENDTSVRKEEEDEQEEEDEHEQEKKEEIKEAEQQQSKKDEGKEAGNSATWRQEIARLMGKYNDSCKNVEACTLTEEALDKPFQLYDNLKGDSFLVWTKTRVYFPIVHGYIEWCDSVSCHPDNTKPRQIGAY